MRLEARGNDDRLEARRRRLDENSLEVRDDEDRLEARGDEDCSVHLEV